MKRYVMHVVHTKADGRWHIHVEGESIATFDTKQQAVDDGKQRGDLLIRTGQRLAQLVVHRTDGTVDVVYTYGQSDDRDRLRA